MGRVDETVTSSNGASSASRTTSPRTRERVAPNVIERLFVEGRLIPDDEKLQRADYAYVNDGTLEGFRHRTLPILAAQFHPEASPGPHDAHYLFRRFVDLMTKGA